MNSAAIASTVMGELLEAAYAVSYSVTEDKLIAVTNSVIQNPRYFRIVNPFKRRWCGIVAHHVSPAIVEHRGNADGHSASSSPIESLQPQLEAAKKPARSQREAMGLPQTLYAYDLWLVTSLYKRFGQNASVRFWGEVFSHTGDGFLCVCCWVFCWA